MNQTKRTSPWSWIPTLYFAEALPYVAVMTISVIMYKRMGISNTDIALYTSWLYLPWVIKPFWSPFVDLLKTVVHNLLGKHRANHLTAVRYGIEECQRIDRRYLRFISEGHPGQRSLRPV